MPRGLGGTCRPAFFSFSMILVEASTLGTHNFRPLAPLRSESSVWRPARSLWAGFGRQGVLSYNELSPGDSCISIPRRDRFPACGRPCPAAFCRTEHGTIPVHRRH